MMGGRGWWLAGLVLGLLAVFHSALLPGIFMVPGDLGDTRVVHFSLEHTWRWVSGRAHGSFWDPPLFYPAREVAAGTDTMLSLGLFYWPWRLLGLSPWQSYAGWLASALAAAYAVFACGLRRLGLARPAAAVGAYVFAFGSPRMANVQHPQLLSEVYLAVAFLGLVVAAKAETRRIAAFGWLSVAVGLAAQAWGAFYPFFFAVLAAGVGGLAALVMADTRAALHAMLRRDAVAVLAAVLLGGVLLAPLAVHYGRAAAEHGPRPWSVVEATLPRWQTWLRHGASSWMYGPWSGPLRPPDVPDSAEASHAAGVGLATAATALAGLAIARRRPSARLAAGVGAGLLLLASATPSGRSLWWAVYELVPAASAIRVVSRVGLAVSTVAAIGVAFALDRLGRASIRARGALLLGLSGLVMLEQAHTVPVVSVAEMRDRANGVARHVGADCAAFAISAFGPAGRTKLIDEDAMWAALLTDVPTVNGRYGHDPIGWRLRPLVRRPASTSPSVFGWSLYDWLVGRGVDPATVCWIDLHMPTRRALGSARVAVVPRQYPRSPGPPS